MVTTVGELLEEMMAFDGTMALARRTGAKVTGAAVKGTIFAYYAIQADRIQRDAGKILKGIKESPGYSELRTVCEAEFGGLTVERLQEMRGRLAIAFRIPAKEINRLGIRAFADEYIAHAASPDLARIAKSTESQPLIRVACWSELAIGVDASARYWARKPAPSFGDPFEISTATRLHFGGKQWPALLRLFAESVDGSTATRAEVVTAFNYLPTSSMTADDKRARPGAIRREFTDDMRAKAKDASKQVARALCTLGQSLRKQVGGPADKKSNAVLKVDGDFVRSGFVVRYLIGDGAGHYVFGQGRNQQYG